MIRSLLGRVPAKVWVSLLSVAVAAIFVIALLPSGPPHMQLPHWDKVQHAFAFCTLWCLAAQSRRWRLWPIVVGLMAFGALIEVAQSFTTYREASVFDWLADGVGVLIGTRLWPTQDSGQPQEDRG